MTAFDSTRTLYIVIDKNTGENLGHGTAAASDLALQKLQPNESLVIPPDGVASDTHQLNLETGQWDGFDARSTPHHLAIQAQMAIQRKLIAGKAKPFVSQASGEAASYFADPIRLLAVAMVGGHLKMADGTLRQHTAAEGTRVLADYVAAQDALDLAANTERRALNKKP